MYGLIVELVMPVEVGVEAVLVGWVLASVEDLVSPP
jgi:hypothetical protein